MHMPHCYAYHCCECIWGFYVFNIKCEVTVKLIFFGGEPLTRHFSYNGCRQIHKNCQGFEIERHEQAQIHMSFVHSVSAGHWAYLCAFQAPNRWWLSGDLWFSKHQRSQHAGQERLWDSCYYWGLWVCHIVCSKRDRGLLIIVLWCTVSYLPLVIL